MPPSRAFVSELILPTYEIKERNPNPVFHETKGYIHPYPYALQDSFAETPVDKRYVTAVIENDFLRIAVIPALGGRLYSAYDKKAKQELFYKNDTIRPQPLAARGAWFSGGLEFNFPVSHSPETMEPVDWLIRENADGSASVILGKTEKLSWMRSLVELRLPADQSIVKERVTCRNPAWLPSRFYFWNNAAVRSVPSTRFIFPFDYTYTYEFRGTNPWPFAIVKYASHEPFFANADIIKWPDASMPGVRNLGCQKDVVQHVSIFGANLAEDFFAAYQPDSDFATVHHADHRKMRGAKFWSWGESGHDRLCQENLTHGAGYYAEIQSGPLETQSDFRMLDPGENFSWNESWFAAAGTHGILAAGHGVSVNLAVNVSSPRSSSLIIYSGVILSRATLAFSVAGREILNQELQLNAASVLRLPLDIDATQIASGAIRLVLKDRQGRKILSYRTTGRTPLKPNLITKVRPLRTASELFQKGYDLETKDRIRAALTCYRQALRLKPSHPESLARMALLRLKAFDLAGADRYLKKVRVKNDFHKYLAGMVALLRGEYDVAQRVFSTVSARMPYYPRAACAAARCHMNKGDLDSAASALRRVSSKDPRGAALKALVYRLQRKHQSASKAVIRGLSLDPLDPVLKAEAERLNLAFPGQQPDRMETAQFYMEMGAWADACQELESIDHPTLLQMYLLGYCHSRLGDEARSGATFAAAVDMDVVGNFPSTFVEKEVLDYVVRKRLDPRAPFLLANMLFSKGRTDDAISLWKRSLPHLSECSVLYRNLGFAYAFRKKDFGTAKQYYLAALRRDPANGVPAQELLSICSPRTDTALLKRLCRLWTSVPLSQDSLKRAYVKLLTDLGQYEKAVRFFGQNNFIAMENSYEIRRVYVQAHLGLARELLDSGNLAEALAAARQCLIFPPRSGAGPLFRNDFEEAYFLCAKILEKTGDIGGALSEYRKCLEIDREIEDPMRPFQLQALGRLNQYAKIGVFVEGEQLPEPRL